MDMYSTSKIIQRSGMKHPQRIVRALTTNAVKVLIVAWAKLCREDVGCCLYYGIPIFHIEGLP